MSVAPEKRAALPPLDDQTSSLPQPFVRKGRTQTSALKLQRAILEMSARNGESLRMYEPLEHIQPFHESRAMERVLRGSNRGGKAQPVDEPVLTPDGWRHIGDLEVGDVILGGDGNPCVVTGVYPQGSLPVFEITFGGGESTRCCEDHLWKCRKIHHKNWSVLSIREMLTDHGEDPQAHQRYRIPRIENLWMPTRRVDIDPYLLGLLIGDGCLTNGVFFSSGDQELITAVQETMPSQLRLRKVKHHLKKNYDWHVTAGNSGGQNELTAAIRKLGLYGKRSHEKFLPAEYLFNRRSVRLSLLQGLMDTDGTLDRRGGHLSFTSASKRLAEGVQFLVRSLGGRAGVIRRKKTSHRDAFTVFLHITTRAPFRLERKLRIWEKWKREKARPNPSVMRSIKPCGTSQCVCIAVNSPDHTYITRDLIITHNTLGAAVEFSRAVTAQDPYRKYPTTDGRAFVVGKDGKHNSEVLYRKLFRKGAFKMLRDPETNIWRSWRPWDPADAQLAHLTKDAPPLIPPRFVKEIGWENKKEHVPNVIRLINGWEIRMFSSLGKPPQGSDIDLAWFDEEIVDSEWYNEIAARLIDRRGRFFWSATAQLGGAQLYDLCQTAEAERTKKKPRCVEFFAHINDNKYFSDDQREVFFDKLTEEQRRIRIEGEFAFTSFKIYPEYLEDVHGVDFFQIPLDWTRYMVVDPGRQICAVLFAAVPPPDDEQHGGHVYLYDELYIRKCDSVKFAEAVKSKTQNQLFHSFIIDHHGGRITEAGSGRTVESQYSEVLKMLDLASTESGHGFVWGSDDIDGGLMAFRNWLTIRPEGSPVLRVFRDKLQNFEWEIKRYHYKRDRGSKSTGDISDKPDQRNNHLMDCCRYLAMYSPEWHAPQARKKTLSGPLQALKLKWEKKRLREGGSFTSLGPSARKRGGL